MARLSAMLCQCYRIDPPSLLAALTDEPMLLRYQETLALELPSLAEQSLIRHLRRLTGLASQVQVDGFENLARADLQAADELLSDLFAVATFHGWELPLEDLGASEQVVDDLPRGLLGADRHPDSARLWLLDGSTLALSRTRAVRDDIDLSSHPRA
jgi:hypothetical protein